MHGKRELTMSSDFLFYLMSVYHRVTRNGTSILAIIFFIFIIQIIICIIVDAPKKDDLD